VRRTVTTLGALALLLFLVLAWVDLRPAQPLEIRPVAASGGVGALRVGAGRAEVALPSGTRLAGYRPMGREATAEGAGIHVRALALEAGAGRTGVLLLELMTLPPSLAERLSALLEARGIPCALVVATHTHSGPGGYDRDLLPQLAAVGRFDPVVEGALLDAAAAAWDRAVAGLGPASFTVEEGLGAWAKNRDRPGEAVDERWTKLTFTSPSGAPIATWVQATAHPTLSDRGVGPHGDWPGVAMARLEAGGGVAFVVQGAVGDARAVAPGVEALAGAVASVAAVPRPAGGTIPLSCTEVAFTLPPPDLRGMVPAPLGRLVSNLAVPLAPKEARMAALRLGDWVWVGIPGEPTYEVATRLEAAWEGRGMAVRSVSLAQGYVGYAVQGTDVIENVFSARNAWFAEGLAPRLWRAGRFLACGTEQKDCE
jgi:hypothetical protein